MGDRMILNALDIVNKAIEFGFDKCGIIPVEMMSEYEDRLEERMEHFPQTKEKYEAFRSFAHLQEDYPWARSVVICSFWYGRYHIPDELQGCIAKYYLTDGRRNPESKGYQTSAAFEKYLTDRGFQVATDRDFGITALRWAAMKACPTGSLEAPYMMCRNTCVSCLTTWDGWDLRSEPLQDRFGKWIYGCDSCQDACPYNRNAWKDEEEFPGLNEWGDYFSYSPIVLSDYNWLESVLQPKLWYIPKGKEWRYKTNALNAMLNNYKPDYLPVIKEACNDEYAEVRDMAKWVLEKITKPV